MKVVFLQEVPRVGKAGEVKEVADGYGRNFLLPQGFALPATPSIIREVEKQRQANTLRQAHSAAELAELAQVLEGKEINLKARVGTKDRLYGSITRADIVRELHQLTGVAVDKRKIELPKPINRLGSHEITIRLSKDIMPRIKVIVEGDSDVQREVAPA
jgi:large subunit ribosomal protein L9